MCGRALLTQQRVLARHAWMSRPGGTSITCRPSRGCYYITGWLGWGFPGRCFVAMIDLQALPSAIARDFIDTAAPSRESRYFWWLSSYVISIHTQGHQPGTALGPWWIWSNRKERHRMWLPARQLFHHPGQLWGNHRHHHRHIMNGTRLLTGLVLQNQTKPPTTDTFGDWKPPANFKISQKMAMDAEELAKRSAIYSSLVDSMVASVISELSARDERSKLLKDKLAVIREVQVTAMSSGFATASNLQLLCRDPLLQNFGFQSQVLSIVHTAHLKDHMSRVQS